MSSRPGTSDERIRDSIRLNTNDLAHGMESKALLNAEMPCYAVCRSYGGMCQVQEDYKNLLRGRVPHFCPCTMSQYNDLGQTSTLAAQACSTPFDRWKLLVIMNPLTKCSSPIQRRTSLANSSRGVSSCTNVCHPFHLTIHCELCEDLSSDALPHITGYTL